ncbi:MAG: hypothetical protein JWN66_2465, partial [Sphingomonas bacterium]|uniref:DUF418 domain-containing protein n=1 Tax=Sphingomonas bacterium TaxID=1895847 RepID=UPI00260ABB8D
GIMQGERPRRFYWRMTIIAYLIGGTLRAIGAEETMRFDDAPHTIWATQEIARQAMTLGHIGLVNLLAGSVAGAKVVRPLVAAGRTALSIYVMQTLICLWLLYPPFALALYGTQGWAEMMVTSLIIDGALLWLANVYLRHFRIAPVEWAWRSIVEGRRLAFRKRAAGQAAGDHGATAAG